MIITKNLSIVGEGDTQTILDGDSKPRVIFIAGYVVADISSVTIQNGYTNWGPGGGVANYLHSVVRLQDCTITGNRAVSGSGVYNSQGTLTIIDCIITDNINLGGGMGSGIESGGDLTIEYSTVSNNKGGYNGGGIYSHDFSTIIIRNSTITGNEAYNAGGGIYSLSDTLFIENSTIDGNTADEGGGIYTRNEATIINSTISNNVA